MNHLKKLIFYMALPALMLPLIVHANVLDEKLQAYRSMGAADFSAERGKALWISDNSGRSCTQCHGQTPQAVGKHNKTGKAIEPMALSANPKRFTNADKIEKWFLRNCKWTLERECTPQEKGDVLIWLQGE